MTKYTLAELEKTLNEDPGDADEYDWLASMIAFDGKISHAAARLLAQFNEAVENGNAKAVRKLLAAGADPNAVILDEPVLNKALRYSREEVAEMLLKAGADPNRKSDGFPLLMQALGSTRLVKLMLDAGANVNARGTVGTILAIAAQRGARESVVLLLNAGAKVDARCAMTRPPRNEVAGCTALFGAALEGDAEIVRLLLESGANPRAVNANGETPLDWARLCRNKSQQKKIMALLVGKGAATGAPVDLIVPQDLNFARRCKTPQYQEALERLKKLTGKKPEALSFENAEAEARGGFGVPMPEEDAKALVVKEREWFARKGCMLFFSRDLLRRNGYCVALLPTTDLAEVLTAVETTGANPGMYTEDAVKWFRVLEKEQAFEPYGIGMDFVEGRLTKPPRDASKLARRMIEFCPDLVVDGKEKAVRRLAAELKKTGRIFFWWD